MHEQISSLVLSCLSCTCKILRAFLTGSFEVENGFIDFYASSKRLLNVVRFLTVKGDFRLWSQKMLSVFDLPFSLPLSFLHPSLHAMFRWALEIEHGG